MSFDPILVVHGGAGTIPDELRENAKKGVLLAIQSSWDDLITGGSALNAVERAVTSLEDFPQFNAGVGSVLTEKGTIEMDALIMDGKTRNIGGVIGVSNIKNPIMLSRKIMDHSAHVIFSKEGAENFAREHNIQFIDQNELITERTRKRLEKFLEKEGSYGSYIKAADPERREKFGTVGAVALDMYGNFAAATSTGGVLGKKVGRVGDTSIPGAGTYADDVLAFSATGIGEFIIRSVLGMEVKAQLVKDSDPKIASQRALEMMQKTIGGQSGLIVVTKNGWAAEKTTKDLIYAAKTVHMEGIHDYTMDD